MEQLYVFHRQQPGPKVHIPVLDGRPVDMWRMRKAVNELGGYSEVSKERKWPFIAKILGFDPKADPSVVSELKTAFAEIIAPFDRHIEQIKVNAAVPAAAPREREEGDPTLSMSSRMGGISPSKGGPSTPINASDIKEASEKLNRALNTGVEGRQVVRPVTYVSCESCFTGPDGPADLPTPKTSPSKRLLQVGEACEVCHFEHDPVRARPFIFARWLNSFYSTG
jgi:hypothetical protein